MTFQKALQEMIRGNNVKRKKWPEAEYCFMYDDIVRFHTSLQNFAYSLNRKDILAKDWEIA